MNNICSCAHVAVLSCAYEFFRMRSIEERMMRVAESVSSMDKAKVKKRFFPIFGGDYQKLYIKNSNIRIEKCSRRNGRMIVPKGACACMHRDALGVDLGNSVRCKIGKIKK
jgi:hypothetical protein